MRNTAPRLRLFGGQRAARRLLALWGGAVLAAAAGAADRWAPRSPEEAVRTFRVEAGLRVEVVAAEPLVASPVAFVFEDARRLYVAEGRGYPGPVDNRAAPPEGRIALLEDRDGDGRFERRTEFAAGLTYPNGLALWRGGVVVTCAPDILYLRDTDGDGVADERSVWLTGFDTAKSTQLRTSHPTLGLDGKFYVTSGLVGGKVTAPLHPGRAPVVFAAADGRFDPATLVFEPLGGRGQFGLTFDGFGRRFVVSNRHPVMQVVLDPADLRRNPHLAFAETAQNVSKVEAEAKVWPLSRASVTADFMPALLSKPHAGTFTSACGTIVFGGTALGAERTGNVFVAEPAQNLVQRQILRPEVATFRAEVAQPGAEFLATDDVWFRPVFLGEGPDGALYVADMYRREIDHPVYVPQEARGRLDFESGKDRGRIYRVVKEGIRGAGRPTAPVPARPLLADLQAADGWTRSTAHRRLLEQPQPERTAELEKIVREAARPEARAASLWVLRAWDRLTVATLGAAAADRDAGVREQAVKLAGEPRGAQPVAADLLVAAARDESARVRFVAALALGSASDERATAALAAIAARDGDDKWTRAAVLSGVGGRLGAFRAVFSGAAGGNAAAERAVMEDVGRLAGAGGHAGRGAGIPDVDAGRAPERGVAGAGGAGPGGGPARPRGFPGEDGPGTAAGLAAGERAGGAGAARGVFCGGGGRRARRDAAGGAAGRGGGVARAHGLRGRRGAVGALARCAATGGTPAAGGAGAGAGGRGEGRGNPRRGRAVVAFHAAGARGRDRGLAGEGAAGARATRGGKARRHQAGGDRVAAARPADETRGCGGARGGDGVVQAARGRRSHGGLPGVSGPVADTGRRDGGRGGLCARLLGVPHDSRRGRQSGARSQRRAPPAGGRAAAACAGAELRGDAGVSGGVGDVAGRPDRVRLGGGGNGGQPDAAHGVRHRGDGAAQGGDRADGGGRVADAGRARADDVEGGADRPDRLPEERGAGRALSRAVRETNFMSETKTTVRVGVIGGGLMGREVASAFGRWFVLDQFPVRAELTAVCDLQPALLDWFRQVPGVRHFCADYRDLLAREDVDVVYVAVPHHLHEEIYLAVLRAGKDLLAEKPFGIDVAAARRIADEARRLGRFVRVSSEFPFFPGAQRAVGIARSGALGHVLEARCAFLHSSDLDPQKAISWKRQTRFCGEAGVMNDLGLHVAHLPLRLGWRVTSVHARLQKIYRERPDGRGGLAPCDTWDNATVHAVAEISGQSAPLTLEMKRLAPGETNTWIFELLGTERGVRFSTKEPKTLWHFRRDREQWWEKTDLGFGTPFKTITGGIFEPGFPDVLMQMWAAFLAERAGLLGNRFGCATPEEAVAHHVWWDAALRSQREQSVVTL